MLLLDEPASGLDPRARVEMRQLLKRLRATGKTIMISSHILPELAICNKVGVIGQGEMKFNGTVTELMHLVRPRTVLNIGVSGDRSAAAKLLSVHALVENVEVGEQHLTVTLAERSLRIRRLSDGRPHAVREEELNLETAFMALTKGLTS